MLRSRRPKGNRVNIPEPRRRDWRFGVLSGNAIDPGDVDEGPGESFLFLLRNDRPGIDLIGDRDGCSVKHHVSCGVR